MAFRLSEDLPFHDPRHQPRSRPARRRGREHPSSRPRQAHALERRLYELRAPEARTTDAAGQGPQEAGGAPRSSAGVRRPLPGERDQGDAGPVAPQDAGEDGADRGRRRRSRSAVQMAADRTAAEPADRHHGEGQRRLRRTRRAFAHRPDSRERRPDRPPGRERQRQIDFRQADRRTASSDGRQDGSGQQTGRRLFRPASGRRPRARRLALQSCRRAYARRRRNRKSAAARR